MILNPSGYGFKRQFVVASTCGRGMTCLPGYGGCDPDDDW